jgi:5-methylcytosine-specific restriction endonuclease McrA
MRKAYILVYSDTLGSREEVKAALNALPQVKTWRHDLPHCFYIISEEEAATLAPLIREKCGNKGRFIILEVGANKQGWLTPESWFLLNNKRHKPKERKHSTNKDGSPFSLTTIDQVWQKGKVIPNFDSDVWRYDICGKPMKRTDYGNTESKHGWEVDHIKPVSKGGGDELSNLQPLQWNNNRVKGDQYPWTC